MKIAFTPIEMAIIKMVATAKYNYAREVQAKSTIYHKIRPIENEIESYGGELAFAKAMNIYPDLDPCQTAWFDSVTADGRFADVKQTTRPDGRLLVKCKTRKHDPDVYALITGSFPDYYYVGMATAEDVLMDENIDENLPNPAFALSQGRLFR